MSEITKKALEASLKNLLRKKPLDKITIQDLTDDCGISRTTFYYHFQDIYELVEWSCQTDFGRALEGKKTYSTWEDGFRQIFAEVYRDKEFIYNVYRYTDHKGMERYLYDRVFDLLYGVVEEQSAGLTVSEADKRFIANFYKYGFVGLMLDWLEKGMKDDPDRLVDRLGEILRGSFAHALHACDKRNTDSHF